MLFSDRHHLPFRLSVNLRSTSSEKSLPNRSRQNSIHLILYRPVGAEDNTDTASSIVGRLYVQAVNRRAPGLAEHANLAGRCTLQRLSQGSARTAHMAGLRIP
jgi:hypothetical protein